MARRKLKLKVRSSSILEVVIAMVIIVIIFSIALTIYANVLGASYSVKEMSARTILSDESRKSLESRVSGERTFRVGEFSVSEKISPYGEEPELFILKLEAFDRNGKSVAVLRKLIVFNHE